jgi:hypothetical protein
LMDVVVEAGSLTVSGSVLQPQSEVHAKGCARQN